MRILAILATVSAPHTALAQPYSHSMADCAALYQNSAQWVGDDKVDEFLYAVRQWHAAAVAQSAKEGKPVSAEAMWKRVDAKTEEWEQKGAMFAFSQEYRDWTAYCRKFAKHVKVNYLMPDG